MSDNSANLQLPYLAAGQAQKHVTVNESLRKLDAIVQLAAVSATTSAQPASPSDGAVYILPAGKSGAQWGAMADGALAYYRDGAWEQITPREGWTAYVRDADALFAYTASAWALFAPNGAAADAAVVHRAGAETITGVKTIIASFPQLILGNTNAAATNKYSLLEAMQYDNAGEPEGFTIFAAEGNATGNIIYVGGGFSAHNAATQIDFYTAANATTRTGAKSLSVSATAVSPGSDNAFTLGKAGSRWSVVYAATGTINTSDAREKTPLAPAPDSVKRAVRRIVASVGVFQWLASVEAKGADRARLHVGVTAQAVRDAFIAEGEDPERWALFCRDAWIDAEGVAHERLGVRTDQLFALALAALADG